MSLDSVKLVGLWLWCAREGHLTAVELRTLLGVAEQRKRRVAGERQRFTESELANITGFSKRRIRRAVAHLGAIGLLRYSEAAIEFSADDRRFCASIEEQQSWWRYRALLSARRRRLPVPRRMLVRMARGELKISVSRTLLAQLIRSSWAWGKRLNPEGCATESWLAETTGRSTRTVRRHRRQLERLGYIVQVGRGHWHRQRFGVCYRVNLEFGNNVSPGRIHPPKAAVLSGHGGPKRRFLSAPRDKSLFLQKRNTRTSAGRPGVQERSRESAPVSFGRIRLEDLTDDARFAELHRAWLASRYGMTGERWQLQFYAARETVLRKGQRKRAPIRNVPGFFRWMVSADPDNPDDQKERLERISQGDEDAARRKLGVIVGLRAGKARGQPTPAAKRCVYERGGRVFVAAAADKATDTYIGESRAEIQRLIKQSLDASSRQSAARSSTLCSSDEAGFSQRQRALAPLPHAK